MGGMMPGKIKAETRYNITGISITLFYEFHLPWRPKSFTLKKHL